MMMKQLPDSAAVIFLPGETERAMGSCLLETSDERKREPQKIKKVS